MFERASGILLHPSSLPSPYGIGDLGPGAFRFIDFLKSSGQRYWQVLPLGPTGFGDSPYQSFSAFAGNHLLISPEKLSDDGLLDKSDVDDALSGSENRVDYGEVIQSKGRILSQAFQNFIDGRSTLDEPFQKFCDQHSAWLNDYALFRALKRNFQNSSWVKWDSALKLRNRAAVEASMAEHAETVLEEKFIQFLFFRQWSALKEHAHGHGVRLIGDLPIFVALDSSDVWCAPSQFKLDESGDPKVVAGVPPDFFSVTGQLWGNPIYDWDRMRNEGFRWWVERMRHTLQMFDVVRIDHFRGFCANYEIPGGSKTAEHGRWVSVPGRDLFSTLKWVFGELPFIAEDLGFITGDVMDLRQEFGFPGMKVLQFGFGGGAESPDLPHNYSSDSVVYTGTHDNDTTVGWFTARPHSESAESIKQWNHERDFCKRYLDSDGTEINWDFVRAALASVASLAIIPMQDLLGFGSEARMNFPSVAEGNWRWRFRADDLSEQMAQRLRELTTIYGR